MPAHVEHVSAGRRVRRYDLEDVLRLAALAHLGRSGLDVATYGPTVGSPTSLRSWPLPTCGRI